MVDYATIIADYSPLISESLAALCQGFAGCRVLGHCSHGEEAWSLIENCKPDVAIIDMQLPGLPALELLRRVRTRALRTHVVMAAQRTDQRQLLETIRLGARAFILKSDTARQLEDGLRQVMEGAVYVSPMVDCRADANADNPLASLSTREHQVFCMLAEGVRARDIAQQLALSPKTVDTYRASLMRKLSLQDTTGLVKFAIQQRITRAGG
ncbi:MAG: response regulator transcription factor [Acidobacteria bacterium]|nr:response regulator transcription factor [Acidobacteriota bacterium]